MKKRHECVRNPDKRVAVEGFGSMSPTRNPELLQRIATKALNMHRSRAGAGCVVAAAANALVGESEFDAAALDRGEVENAKTLGALALKLNESCPSWRLCAEATTRSEAPRGKGSWSAKDKSNWLLSQKEGIFIAQPASKGASNAHIVAVNAGAELLRDPIEPVA